MVNLIMHYKLLGNKLCCELSSHLKDEYIKKKFNNDVNAWPPEQPKEYTKLAFMHHTCLLQPNQEQVSTLARAKGTGNVDWIVTADDKTSFPDTSVDDDFEQSFKEYLLDNKCTKNIVYILELLENSNNQTHCILIEGAPGLGKTILLKQISYEWANRKILVDFQLLFLIPLRNPKVQEFSSVTDLVKHFALGIMKI